MPIRSEQSGGARRECPSDLAHGGRSRWVVDIGKVVDRLLVEHAAPILKEHGFKRRSGPRHWRRASEERVDLIDLHRFRGLPPEVAQMRLELATYIPRLDAAYGEAPVAPDKVKDGTPLSMFAPGMERFNDLWAYEGMDEASTADALREAVEAAIVTLDSIDVTTEEGLVDAARVYFRTQVPLAHAAFGNMTSARQALVDGAVRPRFFDPPGTGPHPGDLRMAERLGVDPTELPTTPVGGFVDVAAIREALQAALPGVFQGALPTRTHLVVRLLRATDEQVALARQVAGGVDLDVRVSPLDPSEIGTAVKALEIELLEAERRRPDLIAVVRSWSAYDVSIETYNLDDETDALIRSHLPDAARTGWPWQWPVAVLERAERHAKAVLTDEGWVPAYRADPRNWP